MSPFEQQNTKNRRRSPAERVPSAPMLAWRAPRATAQRCAALRRGFAAGGHGGEVKQGLTSAGLLIGGGIGGGFVLGGLALKSGLEGAGDRMKSCLEGAGVAHGDRMEQGLKAGGQSVKAGLAQGGALVGAGAAVSSSLPAMLASSLWWFLGRAAPSAQPAGDTPPSSPQVGARRANAAAPPPAR